METKAEDQRTTSLIRQRLTISHPEFYYGDDCLQDTQVPKTGIGSSGVAPISPLHQLGHLYLFHIGVGSTIISHSAIWKSI